MSVIFADDQNIQDSLCVALRGTRALDIFTRIMYTDCNQHQSNYSNFRVQFMVQCPLFKHASSNSLSRFKFVRQFHRH